jgi:hypothetical protein
LRRSVAARPPLSRRAAGRSAATVGRRIIVLPEIPLIGSPRTAELSWAPPLLTKRSAIATRGAVLPTATVALSGPEPTACPTPPLPLSLRFGAAEWTKSFPRPRLSGATLPGTLPRRTHEAWRRCWFHIVPPIRGTPRWFQIVLFVFIAKIRHAPRLNHFGLFDRLGLLARSCHVDFEGFAMERRRLKGFNHLFNEIFCDVDKRKVVVDVDRPDVRAPNTCLAGDSGDKFAGMNVLLAADVDEQPAHSSFDAERSLTGHG